jgi:hypothetical protein
VVIDRPERMVLTKNPGTEERTWRPPAVSILKPRWRLVWPTTSRCRLRRLWWVKRCSASPTGHTSRLPQRSASIGADRHRVPRGAWFQGRRPGSRLVDVAVIDAEADVAAKLGLPERATVVRLERVRYADGEPMAVETVYLDHQRFPDIGGLLTTDVSLYALLEDRYGVVPVVADETIDTVFAPPAESRLLGTDATTPMLRLTRSSSDETGRPVEYVRSLYRGDQYRFIARIHRQGT